MANAQVLALQEAEKARRQATGGVPFRKVADGEQLEAVKVGESDFVNTEFGVQAVYRLDDGKGVFRIGFKIGHPIIDAMEKIAVGNKLKLKRTGKGRKDTRYEVEDLGKAGAK